MLFKKGDRSSPDNYKSIALVKSILKVMNQILLNRLMIWAEDSEALPEGQSRFRKGRSCMDNLFCLSSLVQLILRV